MAGEIRLERHDGGIARVVIDHPERRNAMSRDMWVRLGEVMTELDGDGDLRCVVLAGAGDEAFSAGADISEFEENRGTIERAKAYGARLHTALAAVRNCRHPVVAAIRGLCIGGGLELALCADLRLAGDAARFAIPANRLGLVVALEEMRGLVEAVGKANALRVVLEGDIFDAAEALQMGLVNRVVPDAAFEDHVEKTVRHIAAGAPLTARWHKQFINRLMDPAPLTDAEREVSYDCFATEDFRIGYRAFLEKTRPQWTGR